MVFKNEVKTRKELLKLEDSINDEIITDDKSLGLELSINKNCGNCVVINEKFVQTEPQGGEHWELMFHWIYVNLKVNLEEALYDEETDELDDTKLWDYIDSYNRCYRDGDIVFIEQYSTDMTYAPNKTPDFDKVAKVIQEQLSVSKVYLDQSGWLQHLVRKANRK